MPRSFQGSGRHDNPDLYGCLYASAEPLSVVVEALAPFRGTGPLDPSMLRRSHQPLALAEIELADDGVATLDLDDPRVLAKRRLRPSQVATRRRSVTQRQAAALFEDGADALLWWSTLESSWRNVTVFDRVAKSLVVVDCEPLAVDDHVVTEAAAFLGLD